MLVFHIQLRLIVSDGAFRAHLKSGRSLFWQPTGSLTVSACYPYRAVTLSTCEPSCSLRFRTLPKHERLVDLHGSVIDHTYAGGSSIAVLLIMERLHRDLYTGLKVGPCPEDTCNISQSSFVSS